MALDEAAEKGRRPETIATEIHRQLGAIEPPIPIRDISAALDIHEIRDEPVGNFEALLVTDAERSSGLVLVNRLSAEERRRYSIAHELAHFLCFWHQQTGTGFQCTRSDMAAPRGDAVHVQQEREANTFAIELLAPPRLVTPHCRKLPDLERVVTLHSTLQISKEAAARRYVELHAEPLGVVFAQNGQVRYVIKNEGFPFISLRRGDPLPLLPATRIATSLSNMEEGDVRDWCGLNSAGELGVQVLRQNGGFATVLLHLANDE